VAFCNYQVSGGMCTLQDQCQCSANYSSPMTGCDRTSHSRFSFVGISALACNEARASHTGVDCCTRRTLSFGMHVLCSRVWSLHWGAMFLSVRVLWLELPISYDSDQTTLARERALG